MSLVMNRQATGSRVAIAGGAYLEVGRSVCSMRPNLPEHRRPPGSDYFSKCALMTTPGSLFTPSGARRPATVCRAAIAGGV